MKIAFAFLLQFPIYILILYGVDYLTGVHNFFVGFPISALALVLYTYGDHLLNESRNG